jgi:nucleosome binding factor SPN SPT16 subunit
LRSDCIILGLGSLYRSYNSYISRTLLIDPTDYQKSIYKKVETFSKVVTQNLRAGVKLCDVYKKAKIFL